MSMGPVLPMIIAAVLLAPPPTPAAQQAVSTTDLEGAWQLVQARSVAPDGSVRRYSTQESLLLLFDGFYSMNWASGDEPAPFYEERFRPTDEEKLARYSSLLINAGRYEVDSGRLVIHPLFALVPEFVGGRGVFEISLTGDTLELHWTGILSADGMKDPATARGFSWKYTFERID